ncbi:MAG: electron transport complex subunit RsxC [Planctomycetota bacterium]|jgi:electron transport complex protein RnfC
MATGMAAGKAEKVATRRFAGGVHPHDAEKPRTRGLAVETLPAPARAVVALQQHIGAPAMAVVKKGDTVARGQPIAEAGGFVSVPYHAPVSGKVVEVGTCLHVLGHRVPAVVIENDGEDRLAVGVGEPTDTTKLGSRELVERIQAAGLCGMGGAGFPTHVKLSPPESKPIDTLMLNGAECEPALSADHRVMLEDAKGVVGGARLLARALERGGKRPRTVIALEDNKPDAAEALRAALDELGGSFADECEIVMLPVWYPQGAEKQLIFAITGREVPPASERGLPMDVGCVVQNVGTAVAVCEALERTTPLTERVLTVAGDAVGAPANLRVRIGTPIPEVLAGRDVAADATKLIMGGPMMGIAQYTDDLAVTKTTSGVLVERGIERAVEDGRFDPCIRCGRCVEVCPMGLVPSRLSVLAEAARYDDMPAMAVIDCIECGCCAYTCPARRPIVHHVKLGKWVMQQAAKKARAEEAARAKEEADQAAKDDGKGNETKKGGGE